MGVDYNTYIGAYLVVKAKQITTHTKTIHCKNHPKRAFKEEGFCPECGSRLVVSSVPKQEFANVYSGFGHAIGDKVETGTGTFERGPKPSREHEKHS